ncbi:MAG TPA: MBL fold metallo-hydrolase [Opitutaceae bacterium]|nr:MBL fold metallo-hydrolase [Opitutaceae bacterium]
MHKFRAAGYPESLRVKRRPGDGRFVNLGGREALALRAVLKWKLGLGPREEPHEAERDAPETPAPRVEPDLARVRHPEPGRIQLTWIGHATWLIQAGGVAFLTDPIFSADCSPYPVPRIPRRVAPGLALADLPAIDAVLLSHGHYDHCDIASLRALKHSHVCAAPLGLAPLVRGCTPAAEIVEAEWGDRIEGGAADAPFALTCAPAQHATARSAFDRNKTLWCGWLIEVGVKRIYFAGDTGYAGFFGELGAWIGGVDVALLPIGAYRPRWFMKSVHCDPAEAVRIHRELRARRSLAMHWGTFVLTDEPLGEPPLALARLAAEAGLAPGEFTAIAVGETVVV